MLKAEGQSQGVLARKHFPAGFNCGGPEDLARHPWPSLRASGLAAPGFRFQFCQATSSPFFTIGSERKRLPVAAKIALATAGPMGASRARRFRPACRRLRGFDTAIFG